MMNCDIFLPTTIFTGRGCVAREGERLTGLGKTALIVTGSSSAKSSGALSDISEVLTRCGIAFQVFDEVTENPPANTCVKGGQIARQMGADFIIGIGGGSPLDAAKAIAAYAVHPDFKAEDIFSSLPNAPLPLAAIPTTAGTGSEANAYSVLTIPDGSKKLTYKDLRAFPSLSFVDPQYIATQPEKGAISCALDAFCHATESYLSPKSNLPSECFALRAAGLIRGGLTAYVDGKRDYDTLEQLSYGSLMAGYAISVTGTGFPHPMGYNLTLSHGLPHGAACAVFLPAYLNRTQKAVPDRVQAFCDAAGASLADICAMTERLHGYNRRLDDADIAVFSDLIRDAGNFPNGFAPVAPNEVEEIYRQVLGE